MNQTLLFDPETLPLSIRQYHHTLNDDIDGWFHLEPEDVYGKHRHDFYLGYLIHLLCVHKNVLYMLIPMVIQWLREEGYDYIAQAMNYAFWQDTDVDLEVLNGNFLNKLGPFWQLYNIGYWNKFLNANQLLSILHSKVNLQTFNAIENQNGLTRGHFLNIVYSLLKQDPQHPNINTILVTILTNIVHYTRSELARDDSVLEHTNDLILVFASRWLAFVPDSESLYNSLYPENKMLFLGLTNLCQYCYKNSSGKLGERFRNLKETINMLRIYYLCSNEQFEISSYKSIVKTLLTIQGPNVNIDEFLYWLEDTGHSELAQNLHIYDDSIIDDFNI
ncbi:uncharacterized protein SPAPADRAFT_59967 [Spathaspora passalidarum NRRL Y-27907]|uniref:Uncharacterized protein n=1 Tax=Spathaspora passalidarum (strain NRRL Y-27907 / 11-Y1) TaxID=619300 RepID=G3AJ24_SPAPN|nr:uncharacterized protein SPAPADRAFT_59967 [Spathaspora passalidarum NRRL Y-27907]EGW34536.1 hypothetical protein SPAPADRAFT_59967 [Spathaspora passalidarum NRRL Y-27907]